MLVTSPDAPAAAAAWRVAFASGVQPRSAVGGALFPCLSGCEGAAVRVNVGLDPSRPLSVAPPSPEYRPAGHALAQQVRRLSTLVLARCVRRGGLTASGARAAARRRLRLGGEHTARAGAPCVRDEWLLT